MGDEQRLTTWIEWYRFARRPLELDHAEASAYATARYVEERGHPRLRMRHLPFAIDGEARNRWVALMDRALDDAELPPEAGALLRAFFHSTATFLRNR